MTSDSPPLSPIFSNSPRARERSASASRERPDRRVSRENRVLPQQKPGARVAGIELDRLLESRDRGRVVALRRLRGREIQARLFVERVSRQELLEMPFGVLRPPREERRARAHPI